jgi:hypothetical protein
VIAAAAKAGAIAKVKIGGTTGFLYDADTGLTDDGAVIAATVTTKRNDYGAPDQPKRVRFMRAEGDGAANASLAVQFQSDFQGFPSFNGTLNFDGSPGSVLGVGVLGAFVLGSANMVISTRTAFTGVCRNAQPKFYGSSRWSLRGFSLGVQLLRRRM